MRDDDFEWDDLKAAGNFAKHGVSFGMARDVFADEYAIEMFDHTPETFETRFKSIGSVQGRILAVSFTVRGDLIRIISARLATASERRRYHEA